MQKEPTETLKGCIAFTLNKAGRNLLKTIDAIQKRLGYGRRRTRWIAASCGLIPLLFILAFLTIGFVSEKEAFLNEQLANHQWEMASTVYASATLLREGTQVTQEWLINYLRRLDYQATKSPVKRAQYI